MRFTHLTHLKSKSVQFFLEVIFIERTISAMVGKGSVNHNSRKFSAKNVDVERTKDNVEYINDDIRKVYHELFDEALEKYNAKQTRNDRKINDYYEKIRTGKQEKLFHEVIFQVGNRDDTNAKSDEGKLSAQILDEFMSGFQERNPNLRVFSAHLHMDEETPHLHIDFVPFTTGSKRGLETRVSLKKALAAQGFTGGSLNETEWKQWVNSEKEVLAQIMSEHNVQWKQLGSKEKHLSVLDFEKKMRAQEVAELEKVIEDKCEQNKKLQTEIDSAGVKLNKAERRQKEISQAVKVVQQDIRTYEENEEWQLPEVGAFETAAHFRSKKAVPLIEKSIVAIQAITMKYIEVKNKLNSLQTKYKRAIAQLDELKKRFSAVRSENERLAAVERDLECVKRVYGTEMVDKVIEQERGLDERYGGKDYVHR